MNSKDLVIRVTNEKVFFNPQVFIPIQQTDIPYLYLKFRSSSAIYWRVEMITFNSSDKTLKVTVTDYAPADISGFNNQHPKEAVSRLSFAKFDWRRLEPQLISYTKSKFLDRLENAHREHHTRTEPSLPKQPRSSIAPNLPISPTTNEVANGITKVTETFWVRFDDAQIGLGLINFRKYIKRFHKELQFSVANGHLIPEFENVKSWFVKRLKTKKFNVTAEITLINNEIQLIITSSEEIDQITPELIESVKDLRTLALAEQPKETNPLKSLFTAADIFSQIDIGDNAGNVFGLSEQDILNIFVEKRAVRNKRQLEYLAKKKQSLNNKLRYTLRPHFGFLFFVEGSMKNHFVWELLKSHATYIWSFNKLESQIEVQFLRIEDSISKIKASGRDKYKSAHKEKKVDSDIAFNIISHDDITSTEIDGFEKWKSKLQKLIGT